MTPLLSTAYWPNIQYFFYLVNSAGAFIEQCEHYEKQSYRNRTIILSANGPLQLIVPVVHKAPKQRTADVEICYRDRWQARHWTSLVSAYRNSPYFEFFEDDLKAFYNNDYRLLLDYNLAQTQQMLKWLRCDVPLQLTAQYQEEAGLFYDLRQRIHPKRGFESDTLAGSVLQTRYYQTFEHKFGFLPNLSILDLFFNCGADAKDYLEARNPATR